MVSRGAARGSLNQSQKTPWPLSIFVPHGASTLSDYALNGDALVQWSAICELARRGHRITVVAPAASIRGDIPKNVDIHIVAGGENMSLPRYVWHAYAIYRRLRRTRRFDLIHQMNPVVRGVTIPWALSRAPVVLGPYVGDWPYEVPRYRMKSAGIALQAKMLVKILVDGIQQILATRLLIATPFARNRIVLPAVVKHRIVELPHGIDVAQYSDKSAEGDPDSRDLSVVFLGLVMAHKGIAVLLEAFDLVLREISSAKLIVIGTGPFEPLIARYAESRGWASQIEVVGQVSHDQVAGWLRACSIVCSPSLGEPFGQVVIEALACGRPVIVNDSGGPHYIVAGTKNPVVPIGDPVALARAIVDLLKNSNKRNGLSIENRRVAEKRFAWNVIVNRLEETYRLALSER